GGGRAGRFREACPHRRGADRTSPPGMGEPPDARPEDLPVMLAFISRGVVGAEEAEPLARRVAGWIERHLPRHPWPGNFRELEQCVRSYAIRQEYHPLPPAPGPQDARQALADDVANGRLTFEQLRGRYFAPVYRLTGDTHQPAGRLLGCDWRTLRASVDEEFLRSLARLPPRVAGIDYP